MVLSSKSVVVGLTVAVCGILGARDPALGADLGPTYAEPATNKWQFSLTPMVGRPASTATSPRAGTR